MRDVAKELSVSIATVSRALGGDPRVLPETREKVRAAAERMGYEEDPALGALNHYREGRRRKTHRGTIAWLTNFQTPDGWREVQTNVSYFQALQQLAGPRGYQLEPFWLHPVEMPAERLDRILLARGLRGIFLSSLPEKCHRIDFRWDRYCVVSLSETVHEPRVHSAQKSTFFDIRTAVSKLAELGYRRPILAAHTRYHDGLHGILEGGFWAATWEFLGCQRPVFHARRTEFYEKVKQWIAETKADSVLASVPAPPQRRKTGAEAAWVHLVGDPNQTGNVAATLHHHEVIAKAGLDLMTGMLQRGEVGLPVHPLVVRVQGVWVDGNLKPRRLACE